jgi:5'-nucleotidase
LEPFITTFTGCHVNPLDLKPGDICVEDIAHGLACCNRFAGQAKFPISVAQHSVYVSLLCAGHVKAVQLQALLHDASEAYLGDMTKWVKESDGLAGFRDADTRAQRAIFAKFGCHQVMGTPVEAADKLMVRFEHEQAFGFPSPAPGYGAVNLEELGKIGLWWGMDWAAAEQMFLARFRYLERL